MANTYDPATFLSCVDEEKEGDNSDVVKDEEDSMSMMLDDQTFYCSELEEYKDSQNEDDDEDSAEFERDHLTQRRLLMKKVADALSLEEQYNAATAQYVLSNAITDPASTYLSSSLFENQEDDEGEEDWLREYRLGLLSHVVTMRQELKVFEPKLTRAVCKEHM
uniref:Uncharacterized protein n=2 Tax=Ditylum brightwellii TaxID=49249 RepID=A0A6U3PQJ8_9STRA|mmetsp:Transcript_1566/g.2545  ORF Transcript_1566/g.2545 Transcript_1566/m.2545 type:complete len:164 (+) Transcript_1566:253-744(+)